MKRFKFAMTHFFHVGYLKTQSLAVWIGLILILQAGNLSADSKRPVPRFVTQRAVKAILRSGPGTEYPALWVLQTKGMPLKVVAEYDQWRQINLPDDSVGWIHQSLLSGKRALLVLKKTPLIKSSDSKGKTIAMLGPKVIAEFPGEKCVGTRCYVRLRSLNGWVEKKNVWGLLQKE